VIGRIGAPHGVKGWVKIVPFAGSPGALAERREWTVPESLRFGAETLVPLRAGEILPWKLA